MVQPGLVASEPTPGVLGVRVVLSLRSDLEPDSEVMDPPDEEVVLR